MKDVISEVLIRIIRTYSNNNDLINTLYCLINSNVLNKKELKLCNSILEELELLNTFDLKKDIEEIDSTVDVDKCEGYKLDEVTSKIDDFIHERKQDLLNELREKACKNVLDRNYDKETIDFIYNSFSEDISIKPDSTLDDMYKIIEENDGFQIGYSLLDYYLRGLEEGVITTIVGSEKSNKSILCLNIAYNLISSGKNVLYFSIGARKKDIYKKLLVRHSCSESKFTKLILKTSYVNDNEYSKVYSDFSFNYGDNVIVVDESDFFISTHYSLLKLLVAYDNQFNRLTHHGIDIIIVDDLSKMKLFNGKKFILNKNTIASEIMTLLKSNATNFLCSGRAIPVLITYEMKAYNPLNIGSTIPDVISCLSDNIVMVANSDTDIRLSKMGIQVFKSVNGEAMNSIGEIGCEYKHCYCYDKKNEFFNDSKEALEEVKKQNASLLLFDDLKVLPSQKNDNDDLVAENIKLDF